MKKLVADWTVTAALGSTILSAAHGENVGATCEQEWLARSSHYTLEEKEDYVGLLQEWKQLEPRCRGTVAYEARLATIYFYLDQPEKAREAIRSVAGVRSDYDNLIEFSAIQVELNELMLSKNVIEERQIRALESKLEAYVRRHPTMTAGHAMLGGIKVELGDHEAAIREFKAGLTIDDPTIQKWGLWRHLAVSYTKLELYSDALDAAGSAIKLKPDATRDREFIYAMALSETHLGLLDDAQKALQLTLTRYPEVKQDPEFQAIVRLVYDKLERQKQPANP